jgi:hypothetical protein
MRLPLIRPRVAELQFRVDSRCFHPELFQTLAFRRVQRSDDLLQVRIIPSGHVLQWTQGDLSFTESLIVPALTLPDADRKLQFKCAGSWRGRCEKDGIVYGINGQVELMEPDVFQHVHDELAADGLRRGLLFHFQPQTRLGLTPLSYMTVEAFPGGLSISAFHTFPDELTVLRTQSLIEL